MQNLQNELIALLKDEDNLVIDGQLNKNKIVEAALKVAPQLLKILIGNETFKKHFFQDVEGVLVFDKIAFQRFVNNKSFLPDSYTAFKNKIGLTINDGSTDNYISTRNDVTLVWAHKDCILEGGQTKEDQKRNEIFWNETLAPDAVDRLLSPKAFTNFKKYDKEGEHTVTEITGDENLILKGNNLLCLASLLKTHRSKIKLIYIDPPYNTGSDSFQYNDNFNHSTWLTFMKNRLEIAMDLLTSQGVLFVQCDDNEQAYLKVLIDEVLGKDNFVDTFVWKNTDNAPALSKKSRKNIEFIHCYEKNINKSIGYIGRQSDNDDAPLINSGNPVTTLSFLPSIIKFNLSDGIYKKGKFDKVELLDDLEIKNGVNLNTIRLSGKFKWGQSFLNEEVENGTYFLIKTEKFSIRYKREIASNIAPDKFIDDKYLSKAIGVETNEDSKKHIDALNLNFNSFPKPETLIAFLINSVTKEDDFVMDFHVGSGTTAAVAHKMNRKYIGIEQMDYINTVTVERLKKVIAGEQGGISKAVNWQGDGSFVYAELMQYNQRYIDAIQDAETKEHLISIWHEMEDSAFLSYQFDRKAFNERLAAFTTAPIEQMKQYLVEVLDKNQLYVNYSEMEDETYNVSAADIETNKQFYAKR
ncbi:site-specific DNA-methyltransferase [Flavobacterium salilacus subsp. salilacus]|uniref:DNA methyltransferase n=1 Tax=Flavobacterium TaxID=237 RepID=UPI0010750952|nr:MULTISPECIES: site-specific DNA-methyltransferase [Flavobacterium]KAF2515837.1 site-specific DNA-methyltransferase [Flavobacterium salilacus subsp. salilacus]MBE1615358.1 site-specific DNA-methyltransferase [Flavobacterium sp. SaA2.13]